jgi:acyl carrier protein
MKFPEIDPELQKITEQLEHVSSPLMPIKEVLVVLEKAIHNTRDAVANAISKQSLVQNQYAQAKTEISNSHKQALESAQRGEQSLAMQALFKEAVYYQVADTLEIQAQQQQEAINLLNQNLQALIQAKNTVQTCIEFNQKLSKNDQLQNCPSPSVEASNKSGTPKLSTEDILARTKKVISNQLSMQPEDITIDDSLVFGGIFPTSSGGLFSSSSSNCNDYPANSLGMDGLDGLELSIAIEEEFDIEIPEQEGKLVTVKELVDLIFNFTKGQ